MTLRRHYEHKEAIRLYVDEEWSGPRIAKKMHVHHSSIYKMLAKNGIKVRTIGRRKGVISA